MWAIINFLIFMVAMTVVVVSIALFKGLHSEEFWEELPEPSSLPDDADFFVPQKPEPPRTRTLR